uniref:Uncharacterized protein n=1 Tax=Tetraselmis sp. GSL018 TaxID=582737 RepID=A0A061RTB2_9CHLO
MSGRDADCRGKGARGSCRPERMEALPDPAA